MTAKLPEAPRRPRSLRPTPPRRALSPSSRPTRLPVTVLSGFLGAGKTSQTLSKVARLDTMVTVVDAKNFLRDFKQSDSLQKRRAALNDEDDRTVTDLLIDQVEFCDVIVLNKTDLVTAAERRSLRAILTKLNPRAHLVESAHGRVPLAEVLNTGRFDFAEAQQAPGWMKVMPSDECARRSTIACSPPAR